MRYSSEFRLRSALRQSLHHAVTPTTRRVSRWSWALRTTRPSA